MARPWHTVAIGALVWLFAAWCTSPAPAEDFPPELVDFTPYAGNPVFAGTGADTWDRQIRERGYILREGDTWHLWYTGYNRQRADTMSLGYATSPDGIHWTRYPQNPIYSQNWVEDMQVVKVGDVYYMVAEGRHDIAHWLTSRDRVHWEEHGPLDIRYADGRPLSPGPYGTPVLWVEGPTWRLFYERGDRGIWLAASTDHKVWTNVQDDPVIRTGPEPYDRYAVALNQVVKYKGRYYGYYHANADPRQSGPWTTNVAASRDLVHWEKYAKNPIIRGDFSSAILVHDGQQYRLYTMHPDVRVYFPRSAE